MHFYKADKTIDDVPLKSLTFQTGQINWDRGSSNLYMRSATSPTFLQYFHKKF